MLSRPAHDLTDEEGVHKSSRTLLQTFKSKDKWEQWRFKSRSKLIKAKIWNTTQYIRPIQPDMIQLTAIEQATLTAEQIVFNNNLAEGTPPDDTPIPTTRLENAQQLALRQLAWDTENQGLYDALVECVEDEPLQIVQGTTEGDGRSAWNELMKRYGNVTIASQLAIIKELFELKLKNGIEQHVTTWKASLRKLVEYNLIFGDPIIVVMFLQSLPATYSPFKTYSMMQPEIKLSRLVPGCHRVCSLEPHLRRGQHFRHRHASHVYPRRPLPLRQQVLEPGQRMPLHAPQHARPPHQHLQSGQRTRQRARQGRLRRMDLHIMCGEQLQPHHPSLLPMQDWALPRDASQAGQDQGQPRPSQAQA
jgi:hypothetical protein